MTRKDKASEALWGFQYFRTPTPKADVWARDLKQIADLGFTAVRYWMMWNSVGRRKGEFDFSEFDRLMDLAAKNGLKAILQLVPENCPYWLDAEMPEARYVSQYGRVLLPMARPNTPGGGWPGLCIDNARFLDEMEAFYRATARRFKGHPALYGYDVWNETHCEPSDYSAEAFCYCPASEARFREYLKTRYGDIDQLNAAWGRAYGDWSQVIPPRYIGGWPDWMDWINFRWWTHEDWMRRRVAGIKQEDPDAIVVSHGLVSEFKKTALISNDEFALAGMVDEWGASIYPGYGAAGWEVGAQYTLCSLDYTRSAARGKRIWTAEFTPAVGYQLSDKNDPVPANLFGVRALNRQEAIDPRLQSLWSMASLAGGSPNLLYWQYRAESLGGESPKEMMVSLEGEPIEHTREAAAFPQLLRERPELLEARPPKGEIAMLAPRETLIFTHVANTSSSMYHRACRGMHRLLLDLGFHIDIIRPDQMGEYQTVVWPFPIMIEKATAAVIRDFVKRGGLLIAEGKPAEHYDHGWASLRLPGLGLDKVFGVSTDFVIESRRDLDVQIGKAAYRSVYQQQYLRTEGAEIIGAFSNGRAAISRHAYGKGTAVLIGDFPGFAHTEFGNPKTLAFMKALLKRIGLKPALDPPASGVYLRVHELGERRFLYALNTNQTRAKIAIPLKAVRRGAKKLDPLSGRKKPAVKDGRATIDLPGLTGHVYEALV